MRIITNFLHKTLTRWQQNYIITTFKKNLSQQPHPNFQSHRRGNILKPVLFTFGVSAGAFGGCAILQYERLKSNHNVHPRRRFYGEKGVQFRKQLNRWWNNLHEGQKVAASIIGINLLVFTCWQFPANRVFMTKWFTSTPLVRNSSPLLWSCFSHSEIWHIGANMFVLWSFSPLIQSLLGTEQFFAFYIAGGTFASLASHCFKVATALSVPSLGASGALLAVLAACCIERPDAQLSILFLPFFTFSAQTALYSIIALDVTGLLLRWKLFDHACHLGGTMFGSWYIMYGHKMTWDKRGPLISWWHSIRKEK